jgi:hypothetical protein
MLGARLVSMLSKKRTRDKAYDPFKEASSYAYTHRKRGRVAEKEKIRILDSLAKKGYQLDSDLSDRETSVFVNPETKQVMIAHRGTDLSDPKTFLKDLKSDGNILIGKTRRDKRFLEAEEKFNQVKGKYSPEEYQLNVTGHSLGGALAKHVNQRHEGEIARDVNFSRGSSPFPGWLGKKTAKPQDNQVDISNAFDPISLGARMQGGNQVVDTTLRDPLDAHGLQHLK